MMLRLADAETAAAALHTAAPVGEKDAFVAHAFAAIGAAMPQAALEKVAAGM
jgi:hypothetical protein